MNERGKSSPFRLQSYEFPKQTQTKIAKTFHFIKIHSNDTPTLHADSRQKLVYYLAKTETFSTKRHCFIHRRPIRPHFLLAPTLLPLYARLRALSEFSFFAFTDHRISLILFELEVKENPLKAFTRCSEKKSHRENRMSPTSQRVNLRLHVPSPLSSPSTSCISNQCRAPTLFFEVKKIGRAFTLFVHLSL